MRYTRTSLPISSLRGRPRPLLLSLLLFAAVLLAVGAPLAFSRSEGAFAQGAGDWPTYLHDLGRSGFDPAETTITQSSAPHLKVHWSATSAGVISTQPTVADGLVLWGSWDGEEHAANATTGALLWTANLGQTTDSSPSCSPHTVGVADSAAVGTATIGGLSRLVVFVAGGNDVFYALDAHSGAVLWKTSLGTPPADFLWGSPALFNGSVYEGVASFGDCPNTNGRLDMLSQTSGAIEHTWDANTGTCTGGDMWGSPTIDPGSNLVFVATGNASSCSNEPNAPALVKLSTGTLAFSSSWQVPTSQQISDSDFGSTPTLFSAQIGGHTHAMVGLSNKNGTFYAFDRGCLHCGPLWTQPAIATRGGTCPQCGNGAISPAAWDGHTLYVAGGSVVIGSTSCKGSVSALNPATGAFLWRHCLFSGPALGAVTAVPGVLAVTEGPNLLLLNAATGATLFVFTDSHGGSFFYGAASISNGLLFVGNKDGLLWALGT